ncbi:hypothetical protein H072_11071 [Dactylellina haptotyla CBS 200.50]|uniref:Transcription factor domain-containing protein n=1 Tax=Dactylellina haptotyla (strain CBS 200.50) TaxID=1284197 RepID=S7ZXK8_DACHA|nr:hypothetical protein H072_11071 [Dactylellina haptotyla CBS 200.50]
MKGNEFDMFICYTRKHLRRGGAIDLVLDNTQLSDVIIAGTNPTKGEMFHRTILSFGTILFGLHNRAASILDQGHAMHGVALKQLNQALSDPKCYYRDDVMLSVATLAILECVVPTGPKNYLKHMIGLERLLYLRGPGLGCSTLTFEIYKSVRHMILFASLRTGRPSILAGQEWKDLFRANCSRDEILEQDLFDILADCTILISQRDIMLARSELDPESDTRWQDEMYQTGLGLLAQLGIWRQLWERDSRNFYSETTRLAIGEVFPGISTSPFVSLFEFCNESAAIMLMFYNTTLIYVLRILASLVRKGPGTLSSAITVQGIWQDPELLDDSWPNAEDEYLSAERLAALEVCRCVPYYALQRSKSTDSHSSPIVQWAISTAWMTLSGNDSAEGKWIMSLVNATSLAIVSKGVWKG